MFERSSGRLFYRGSFDSRRSELGLGIFILSYLGPNGRLGWLESHDRRLRCIVAGWLAASPGQVLLGAAMTRQITAWRQIADASLRGSRRRRYPPRLCSA